MEASLITKNLGIIILVLVIWLTALSYAFYKFGQILNNLAKGTKSANLVENLKQILQAAKQNSEQLAKLEKNFTDFARESKNHLQKVSLLRFNPFSDVGGDQSFVVTFLDGENSGIIISSLHSRAGTRIYAKSVERGKPRQDVKLSGEEAKALKAAVEAENV